MAGGESGIGQIGWIGWGCGLPAVPTVLPLVGMAEEGWDFWYQISPRNLGKRVPFCGFRCDSGDFPEGCGIVANPLISSELAGAGGRVRTDDLRITNALLYH